MTNLYKLIPYDEINGIWILKRKVWWIFYKFVGVGSKAKLLAFVEENGSNPESVNMRHRIEQLEDAIDLAIEELSAQGVGRELEKSWLEMKRSFSFSNEFSR